MHKLLALLLTLALLPGCLLVDATVPLDTDLDKTQLGNKVGRSSMKSVMGLVAWGDAGTQAAAENGGITTIHHADMEVYTVLFGLYYKHTTVVYGE